MSWQDSVFTIGSIILGIALLPSMLGPNKPELATSVMTSCVLYFFAFTYSSLGLVFSTIAVGLTAIMWTILAIQKWKTC